MREGIGSRVSQFLSSFGESFLRRKIKSYIELLVQLLDGLGKERLLFMKENSISLWDILPEDLKEAILNDDSVWSKIAMSSNPERASIVYELLEEIRPDLAHLLGKEFFIQSFLRYKEEKHETSKSSH